MAYSLKYPKSILLVCLIVAVIFGLFRQHLYQQRQEELRIEQIKIEQKEKSRARLDALLEQYVVNFKSDLKKKAVSYKDSRTILKEILSPYNFETKEYTKENYFLFKEKVAPDLRKKAVGIIHIFEKYTKKIQQDLGGQDNKTQKMFLLKWKNMSNQQLEKFIDFFTKEEQLIQAYEELLKFYYVHSNLFSIDVKQNIFLFDREQDKKRELELRQKIKNLKKR